MEGVKKHGVGSKQTKKKYSCFMKQYVLHCGAQISCRSWQRFKEQIDKPTECLSGKGCLGQGHPLQLQKPCRWEAVYSVSIVVCFAWLYSLPQTSWTVCCYRKQNRPEESHWSHELLSCFEIQRNELTMFCTFDTNNLLTQQTSAQAVSSSLSLYITFAQWTLCSTVTKSGYLSLDKVM